MSATSETLKSGLTAPLEALGVDLESVEVQKAGRRHVVRIVVDRDGGVDLDLVAAVSRQVSDLLDVPPLSEALPGPFVLEVTSPGVDRPLTEPRHWRRAVSRLVHITRVDDSEVEGRLTALAADSTAVVATAAGDVSVPLSDVRRAVVQIEFSHPDVAVDPADDVSDDDVSDDDAAEAEDADHESEH